MLESLQLVMMRVLALSDVLLPTISNQELLKLPVSLPTMADLARVLGIHTGPSHCPGKST